MKNQNQNDNTPPQSIDRTPDLARSLAGHHPLSPHVFGQERARTAEMGSALNVDSAAIAAPKTRSLRVDFPDQDLVRRLNCFLDSVIDSGQRTLDSPLAISVDDGNVCIYGKVASLEEKSKLLNSCRRVAGVLRLDDHLEIAPAPHVAKTAESSSIGIRC